MMGFEPKVALAAVVLVSVSVAPPTRADNAVTSAPAAARTMIEQLFQLVETGKADAVVDWINAHGIGFAERDKKDPAWAAKHRQNLQRYLAAGGALKGHALILERVVEDRLVHGSYAVWGADRPLAIGLTLYRRGDGTWVVTGWSFGESINAALDPAWPSKP